MSRRTLGGSPARVLAIRLQALGDTVLTLPYLAALRRAHPTAELDLLTRREVAGIPEAVGIFHHIWALGGGRSARGQALHALTFLPRLLSRRYDVVLDLQRNRVSRFVRRLLGPPIWSEFDRFSPRPAGERTRRTIEAVGLGPLDVRFDVAPKEGSAGDRSLHGGGWDAESPLVVLNAAGAFYDRNWTVDGWIALGQALLERAPRAPYLVFLGLSALAERNAAIAAAIGSRAIDLTGRTTAEEAFAIVARARLVVSEDSGLLHMAWVGGVPTLGLFAASPTAWARPLGGHADVLDACRLNDGRCLHGRCHGEAPSCMSRLEVDEVLERALGLLSRTDHTGGG